MANCRGWHAQSKARAVKQMIGDFRTDKMWDIGAGCGEFSEYLINHGVARGAVCVDPAYNTMVPRSSMIFVQPGDDSVRLASRYLSIILDVVEHVSDDRGLIGGYRLRPHGRVLITAPAFRFLWSAHDDACGHYRRYTLQGLEKVVEEAGLRVLRGRYFFAGLLLPALLAKWRKAPGSRDRGGTKFLPRWADWSLTKIFDIERRLVLPWNRLGGLTAMVLAERPE